MNTKLKVGDRVRIGKGNGGYVRSEIQGLFPGNTGTVVSINDGFIEVRTDNCELPPPGKEGWGFYLDEVERIDETEALIPVNQTDEE